MNQMQTKTTIRCLSETKTNQNTTPRKWQVCWRLGANRNPRARSVAMQSSTNTVEASVVVPQKAESRIVIWSSSSPSASIPPENWRQGLKRYAQSSITHNSEKVEATGCPSVDEWMNKMWSVQTMDYHYSTLKRMETDARYNVDKSQGRYAKWNEPVVKRQILYDSTYLRFLGSSNS